MSILSYDPVLRMALSDTPYWIDEEIAAVCDDSASPVTINEWQSYYAFFYDCPPRDFAKQPFCCGEIAENLFEINFANYVGLSRIGNLTLSVHNRKISDKSYQRMLDDLAGHYASMVFSFATPVGQHHGKTVRGEDSAFVEYLFLKKFLADELDLDAITAFFTHNPHRIFRSERHRCAIQDCRNLDVSSIDAVVNGPAVKLPDGHPLLNTRLGHLLTDKVGDRLFPGEAINITKHESVDSNENRFIKHFMQGLLHKTVQLQQQLNCTTPSALNPDIADTLKTLGTKIDHFLSLNMWKDVGPLRFIPANSQVLLKRAGYRQLYSLYSLLQLASTCDFSANDFKHLAEIKDVPTLYEYWCFFEIKTILAALAPIVDIGQLLNKRDTGHTLSHSACIEYANGIKLFFNKTCSGNTSAAITPPGIAPEITSESYSHNLRPDITLELNGSKIIFDAKYKGKRGGFYCADDNGSIGSWKEDDIDKMHAYRDAIKDVIGSYILFPGHQSVVYAAHNSRNWFEGVGAFSLKPGDTKGKTTLLLTTLINDFIASYG